MTDNWDNEVAEMLKKQRKKYLKSENDGKMKILKEEAKKIMESGQLTIIKEYIEDINDTNIKKEMSNNFLEIENKIFNINIIEDGKVVDTFKKLGNDLEQMKITFQEKMTTLKNAMEGEEKKESDLIEEYRNLDDTINNNNE